MCDVVLLPILQLDGMEEYSGKQQKNSNLHGLKALIDTGATNTCLTPSAVEQLDILPVGMVEVMGIHGVEVVKQYCFQLGFMDYKQEMKIFTNPIEGTLLGIENPGFDVLLGMDVISQGTLWVRPNGDWSFEF